MYTVSLPGSCVIETGVCSMRPYFITARKQSLRRLCFTRVCHSVHRGGGWYPSMPCRFPGPHLRGSLRGLARGGLQAHTPGGWCIPACTEADGYCYGRYASYWNVFLSKLLFVPTQLYHLKHTVGHHNILVTLHLSTRRDSDETVGFRHVRYRSRKQGTWQKAAKCKCFLFIDGHCSIHRLHTYKIPT